MLIGVPKEIKTNEYRVGLTPSGAAALARAGHQTLVQSRAGEGAGFSNDMYRTAGAIIADDLQEVYAKADMIVKVKEPVQEECAIIRSGQILFCYLHLAADPKMATALIDRNCIAIAYETVTDAHGRLPVLAPMSKIAGKLAVHNAAFYLQRAQGGKGVLAGSLTGTERGRAVILGAGAAGAAAAETAAGMGMRTDVLDISADRLDALEARLGDRCSYIAAGYDEIDKYARRADIFIGAVLIPGAAAPKALRRETVQAMEDGSVIVDISIDQGGCAETSRPTTADDPVFIEEGVIHYCVTNIPGMAARTAVRALENASLNYVMEIAEKGYRTALSDNPHLRNGLNIYRGRVTHESVANALSYPYVPPSGFLDKHNTYFG